jgi:hypothetical protein
MKGGLMSGNWQHGDMVKTFARWHARGREGDRLALRRAGFLVGTCEPASDVRDVMTLRRAAAMHFANLLFLLDRFPPVSELIRLQLATLTLSGVRVELA